MINIIRQKCGPTYIPKSEQILNLKTTSVGTVKIAIAIKRKGLYIKSFVARVVFKHIIKI